MGRLAYELGNIYQLPQLIVHNSSVLFRLLQIDPADLEKMTAAGKGEGLSEAGLQETSEQIDEIMARLGEAEMQRPDADLIRREFSWAADMLRHACQRGIWMLKQESGNNGLTVGSLVQEAERLIAEYREIWLARNRPGGFEDSVARMEKMKQAYTA
jgi:hypothetical protein